MGIITSDVFDFDNDNNHIIILKFDSSGLWINGTLIMREQFERVEASKGPETPDLGIENDDDNSLNWTYPTQFMNHFQNIVNLQFGSLEGSTRSYAYYEYIKYHHKL